MFKVKLELVLDDGNGDIFLERTIELPFAPVAGVNCCEEGAYPGFALRLGENEEPLDVRHVTYNAHTSTFCLLVECDTYTHWMLGKNRVPAPEVAAVLKHEGWKITDWGQPGEELTVGKDGLTDRIRDARKAVGVN